MKAVAVTAGSAFLTTMVILNAYFQKKQFYPSVVYITKSSPSMAVLYAQAFVFVILLGKLFRKVFFGQLRAAEMEHLIERSWYAVTETCLAFTVFRDDFSPRFVALFTLLLFLKSFHWLAEDRIDYMERSPLISIIFHLRAIGLVLTLGMLDSLFVHHAYYSTLLKGASVQLVFGFEYAILFIAALHILTKYILHSIDLQSENPWENKAVYLLYTELLLGFVKALLYLVFLFIMIKVHTFPLFAIRPMYLTLRTFKKALHDVIMSRRAIRNMNTLYPNATEEELLQGDNVCIICREEMNQGCKKLPCNHIFHTSCLRSWFQRQQTCPTCRMDVLRPTRRASSTPQQEAAQPPQVQPLPVQMPAMFPGYPPPWANPMNPSTQQTSATTTSSSINSTATGAFQYGYPWMGSSPVGIPPMPFTASPPQLPLNLRGLSDEEIKSMESNEREAVENRIKCLRNISTLLDAAVVQMEQYNSLVQAVGNTTTRGQNTLVTSSVQVTPATVTSSGNTSVNKNSPTSPDNESADENDAIVEDMPHWHKEDVFDSEIAEIRRRRVEKFTSEKKNEENLDLD